MFNKEAKEQKTTEQETAEEEKKEVKEAHQAPEPKVIGNDQIAILKHDIYRKDGDTTEAVSIELAVKNISDITIGSVLFEAELYDIEGNILDTLEKKMFNFKPGVTRNLRIDYSEPKSDKVRSYCVKVAKIAMTPEPTVTGNESVKILKHSLNSGKTEYFGGNMSGIEISIRNVSNSKIASILFEGVFYDIEGNVLDTFKHDEIELKPNTSRAIIIKCKQHSQKAKSYNVRIAKMTLADVEKVQLRRHEIKTTDNGEEEVRGLVKNISNTKTDTALVATFLNSNEENIGTKVIILRDIEPNTLRQFHFLFKPMEGDRVRSYTLNIGDIVE